MAYKIMKSLINNYKNGRRTFSKERLEEMCNVYYGAGQFATDEQYIECITAISELEE